MPVEPELPEPATTPAGWYDDGSGRQRYWDGAAWTEYFADTYAEQVARDAAVTSAAPAGSAPEPTAPARATPGRRRIVLWGSIGGAVVVLAAAAVAVLLLWWLPAQHAEQQRSAVQALADQQAAALQTLADDVAAAKGLIAALPDASRLQDPALLDALDQAIADAGAVRPAPVQDLQQVHEDAGFATITDDLTAATSAIRAADEAVTAAATAVADSVVAKSRDGLDAAIAAARQALDASAGKVQDESVRTALQTELEAATALTAVPTPTPTPTASPSPSAATSFDDVLATAAALDAEAARLAAATAAVQAALIPPLDSLYAHYALRQGMDRQGAPAGWCGVRVDASGIWQSQFGEGIDNCGWGDDFRDRQTVSGTSWDGHCWVIALHTDSAYFPNPQDETWDLCPKGHGGPGDDTTDRLGRVSSSGSVANWWPRRD